MLRVSLLGEQVISDEETGVLIRSSRAVALVAFLVVHAGSPQPRQRIAGLFWPDSTDAQALTNLRRELHQLRQVVGDELAVTARALCWRDTEACRVDLRVFSTEREAALAATADEDRDAALAHAVKAIDAYRGDLLPGVYDDWVLEARGEVERQCVDLCDLVSGLRARRGDLAGAVEAARRRIQLQPLEEVGYRALMRLQAGQGDRAGAVSTYHHCASALERELGIIPDAETQQEFRRLMASPGPDGTRRPERESEAGRSGPVTVPLVGRARELGLLRDLWRDAAAGRPCVALVRGAAGVGKTRLVAEVAELARRRGAVVAGSQCFGTSGRLALAPVVDWLRDPAVRSEIVTLDEAWRAEVDRLIPSGGRATRAAGSRAMADAWQRHRFFEGLARALLAVGRPMLLVLENVQWCDQETLAFVAFCLRLAPGAPLLVAGTVRDDSPDEDPAVRAWVGQMRAAGLLTEVPLGPFEPADTARLAEAVSRRPLLEADRNLLQAATGGFPLYVIEAMRGTVDQGSAGGSPRNLTAVLRNRLEQASAAARDVAGLAAAVGTDFTLDLLAEASDLDAGLVVDAVDELWRRRIVREFGAGYDFAHDLLRETAYAQASPPRRWLLHRRVAQALELLHADSIDMVAAALAAQYARAGRPGRAVDYYRRAADVAAGVFAHAEAIRLLEEALSIIRAQPASRGRDQQELTVLEAMAALLNARRGYTSPALERAVERTIALAQSLGRKDSVLVGMFALWTSRFIQGRTADSYAVASQALALADAGSDLSMSMHFAVAGSAISLGRPAEGLRHFELAAKLAGDAFLSAGTRPDIHAGAWAAHAHWLLGHDDDALASSDHAMREARAFDHPYNLAVTLAYCAITDQIRHDMSRLTEHVGELRELCNRYEFAYYREWALILDGWSRADESGVALAREGISNLKMERSFARMPYWLSLLADLLARNNRPDEARANLDAALAAAHAQQDLWWLPEVMRMRAAYDEVEGAALSRLRAAAQMASAHGSAALLRRCEQDLEAFATRRAGVLPVS
jgi:DNA-binding SARP family transcriptional activator